MAAAIIAVISIQQVADEQHISQEGQITDRYTAAVTQVSNSSIDVRIAGIYALQRIMQDSPRDQPTIVNLLCSYIRRNAALPNKEVPARRHQPKDRRGPGRWPAPKADVAVALQVIGDRNPEQDGDSVVDLRLTDLSGAEFKGAHLPKAILFGARLMNANFDGADLSGVEIGEADLRSASFVWADLRRAGFANSDLFDANLAASDLRQAWDLQRYQLLPTTLNSDTKLSPRLAEDPKVIARQKEGDYFPPVARS